MIISYQITLIIIMLLCIVGVIGEKKDKGLRDILAGILIAAILSFIVSVVWL